MSLNRKEIEKSLSEGVGVFRLGNEILYNICKKYPLHDNKEEIVLKTWLIGRSYAASIERFADKNEDTNSFYENTVAPLFIKSELDNKINKFKKMKGINLKILPELVELHKYLQDQIKSITKDEKRSFSSKYLHFHLPNLFFIYDNIVPGNLNKKVERLSKEELNIFNNKNVDEVYSKFFLKCYKLQRLIQKEYGIKTTPRDIDCIISD